jgi:hypothetical protein
MSKFIQVNKMLYDPLLKKYVMSFQDSLINTDKIVEITPRQLSDSSDTAFNFISACNVRMEDGDMFYIAGSFSDIKIKMMGVE